MTEQEQIVALAEDLNECVKLLERTVDQLMNVARFVVEVESRIAQIEKRMGLNS